MRRLLIAGIGIVAAVGIGYALWVRPRPLPADVLAVVPAGSVVVGHLAVREVLESRFWREATEAAPAIETRRWSARCGFDPVERLRSVDAFVPTGEHMSLSEVGFIARGAIRSEDVTRCFRDVLQEEGVSVEAGELEGVPTLSTRSGHTVAFVGADGAVAGTLQVAQSVLRVVQNGAPSARGDKDLAGLFDALSAEKPQLVLAAVLPPPWRARIDALFAGRGLSGLGGLRAIGGSAAVGDRLSVELRARTGDQATSTAIAAALDAYKTRLLAQPLFSLTVIGSALGTLRIAHEGNDVRVRAELRGDQVGGLLELWRIAS